MGEGSDSSLYLKIFRHLSLQNQHAENVGGTGNPHVMKRMCGALKRCFCIHVTMSTCVFDTMVRDLVSCGGLGVVGKSRTT
jgi:hypothetical protein